MSSTSTTAAAQLMEPDGPRQGSALDTSLGDSENPSPDQSSMRKLWILWSERRLLLRITVIGALLGIITAFLLPKTYESTTQLMPPDSQSSSSMALLASLTGRGGIGVPGIAGGLLGLKSSGALFTGIIRSRSVQDSIIKRFDLKHVYGARLDKDARSKLADRTLVNEDRKTGIISITVTDGDPARAAAIARGYVDELDHTVSQMSTSAAHRERVFLEQRLTVVKQELDRASSDLSQFQSKNATIDIKEQGRSMMEAAAALMGQLSAAESELKGLEQIYASNNIRVRSVRARIDELRNQLEKIGGPKVSAGKAVGSSTYPSIRELPLLGVTYADLYRRAKIQEAVYETLTQEYELAKVQEAKETPSVKVLDAPAVPETKSSPHRMVIVISFAMLFLVAGAAFCWLRIGWNEMDADDPRKVFLLAMRADLATDLAQNSSAATIAKAMRRRRRSTDLSSVD